MNNLPPVSIAILAAGSSSRFGGSNKLLEEIGGRSILEHSISLAGSMDCAELLVITGKEDIGTARVARRMFNSWTGRPIPRCVLNEKHDLGMAESIVCAARAARSGAGILIWLADMPLIESASVVKILAERSSRSIVIPVYEGRRGHPVFFGPKLRPELAALAGERGARSVVEGNADLVTEVIVDDPMIHFDIDTQDDLEVARTLFHPFSR